MVARLRSASTVTLLALAPLLVATLVGLIVLWPEGKAVTRPPGLGQAAQLIDGRVTVDHRLPCRQEVEAVAAGCHDTTVRITSGPDHGTDTQLEIFEGPGQPALKVGDRIVLGRTVDPGGTTTYYFADFQRRTPLVLLALLFAAVVIAVGRLRGLAALVGLVVSFGLLAKFMLPSIIEGNSALTVAIVTSAALMFVLLYLAHGVSAKTSAALLGTLASLAITGVLAALFVGAARVASFGNEDTAFLQINAHQINLGGLLLGGILIGSLGVLNDVTVTQASAVWALHDTDPTGGFGKIYGSAMRIGRDHIASTVDTLVLAYAGAALPLLLLFTLASRPVGDVVTGELVAEEIIRALVGGIGIAASVPITTSLAALAVTRHKGASSDDTDDGQASGAPATGAGATETAAQVETEEEPVGWANPAPPERNENAVKWEGDGGVGPEA